MNLFDWLGRRVAVPRQMVIAVEAENLYLRELALHIAVDYYAQAIANCEFQVFVDGKPEYNELYYALNVAPNPNTSGAEQKRRLVEKYFYDGRALMFPLTFGEHSYLYVADGFGVEEDPLFGDRFVGINVGGTAVKKTFKATDAYCFRQGDRDIAALVNAVGESYGKLMSSAASAYKASAGQKYTYDLGLDNRPAGNQDFEEWYRKTVAEPVRTFLQADNGVFPLQAGRKLERLKGDARSVSDVLELRKDIFSTYGQALHIPLSMMEGNTTTLSDVIKSFLTFGVDPLARVLSDGFTRNTFSFARWRAGCRIHVDTSHLSHNDFFDTADNADKLIRTGVACIDEVREALGLQPLNTEWSRAHVMTKNNDAVERLSDPLRGGETE